MIAVVPVPRAIGRYAPILVSALCLLSAGCASQPMVRLRPQPYGPPASRLSLLERGIPQFSPRTQQLLERYDLTTRAARDPYGLVESLAQVHDGSPGRETAFALAEVSYLAAGKYASADPDAAMQLCFYCCAQAYSYLFDEDRDAVVSSYDPQFRSACDLYNAALEKGLRIARRQGRLRPGRGFTFTIAGRRWDISIEPNGSDWAAEDFDSFEFVSDFELTGLSSQYRTYGLGVPLIAVRKAGVAPPEIERYYAPGLSFPITAFLRIEPEAPCCGAVSRPGHADDRRSPIEPRRPPLATVWANRETSPQREGTNPQQRSKTLRVELYDPLETTTVSVAGRPVPLESDISTPLAYFLDRPAFRYLDTFGLLRPDMAERITGLYMIRPYEPGKIPVVMVHGLWSSPVTWIEAVNELWSVPEIRANYQFWFYLYPTGQSLSQAAARLREDLDRVDEVFLPRDGGPALRSKVLVGHSMGGLMARLMTLEGGGRFWNSVSERPLHEVDAPAETKAELRQVFFFDPNRTVRRVVTIAAPFRGSDYSNSFTRWLGRKLIALPLRTVEATRHLLARNPGTFRALGVLEGKTSVDALAPDSPFLQAMRTAPVPPRVKYHNIVGVTKEGPLEENGDGIVPYLSAHLDDVESEIVVPAFHSSIQRQPETVREIRRILLEHLVDFRRGSVTGIVPVGGWGAKRDARGNSNPDDLSRFGGGYSDPWQSNRRH